MKRRNKQVSQDAQTLIKSDQLLQMENNLQDLQDLIKWLVISPTGEGGQKTFDAIKKSLADKNTDQTDQYVALMDEIWDTLVDFRSALHQVWFKEQPHGGTLDSRLHAILRFSAQLPIAASDP